MKRFACLACGLAALLAMGCENINILEDETDVPSSTVAKNVAAMKTAGLFDDLLNGSRNASATEEEEMIQRFINDTDSVLLELGQSEEGNRELKVIEALFGGGTTEDFEKSLAYFNSDKAAEFSGVMQENFGAADATEGTRNVAAGRAIKLAYYVPDASGRAAFASDMEWSTIGWYTGFCAATIAGCYAASYGGFWTRIVGKIAAGAGVFSMARQLLSWYQCSELFSFVSSLKNKDESSLNRIAKSTDGKKIITITAETTGTVLVCRATPFGRLIMNTVVKYYNLVMGKILSIFPPWLKFFTNGISISVSL